MRSPESSRNAVVPGRKLRLDTVERVLFGDIPWTSVSAVFYWSFTGMGLSSSERSAPQSKHIRFTHAQDKRLEEACTYLGCTLQSFVQEAALERLAKVEAEQRADKEYRERSKKSPEPRRKVRGLGLREDRPDATAAVEPAPPPAPQVVVNVPAAATTTTTTSSTASDVSMLAAFVAKGSVLGRDLRLERAREILATSLDGAALDAAKKALDEAVAAHAPKAGGVLDWFKR